MSKKTKATLKKGQVCRNHPDYPAVELCETCLTPVCEECVYERDGIIFCSRNCAANYEIVYRNLNRYQSRKKADRRLRTRRRLKMLARIGVYTGILLFAWWFYVNYTREVHYWLDWLFNAL